MPEHKIEISGKIAKDGTSGVQIVIDDKDIILPCDKAIELANAIISSAYSMACDGVATIALKMRFGFSDEGVQQFLNITRDLREGKHVRHEVYPLDRPAQQLGETPEEGTGND